jgi:GTPase
VTDAETRGIELLTRGRSGDISAVSQLITALEGDSAVGRAVRPHVHSAAGHAHVLGVTGAPGSGKSTLVNAIMREARARRRSVGVVAVDPSSSLTAGSILGDRIRMQEHTLDPGIFVRSMSSRGKLGGLARATVDAIAVLDAAGRDLVIVETVGAGQADVEIVQIAQTTLVVSVPGLGDDIQAIKAGLLETADIHVVNKADRPESNRTVASLVEMLGLRCAEPHSWTAPVLSTEALNGGGIRELLDAVDEHLAWLKSSGEFTRREREAALARIQTVASDLLLKRMRETSFATDFSAEVEAVIARRLDPHAAAVRLIDHLAPRR